MKSKITYLSEKGRMTSYDYKITLTDKEKEAIILTSDILRIIIRDGEHLENAFDRVDDFMLGKSLPEFDKCLELLCELTR